MCTLTSEPAGGQEVPTHGSTALRQRREAVINEHIDAENRHDADATVATFSPRKASYDVPAFGQEGQRPDHESIREMWVGLLTVFPDLHIEPRFLRHGDDHILVEVRVSGTQKEEWAGIPATLGRMDTRVAALYEFEGDELVCERVYMDFAEIARQLGGAS